jgi:hypothetical protein
VKPNQLPMQLTPEAISTGIKRPGSGADHSPPFSAEVKNGGDVPLLRHMSSWNNA